MKKIESLVIVLVLNVWVFAQEDSILNMIGMREIYKMRQDSLAAVEIKPGIVAWQLIHEGIHKKFIDPDTAGMTFQLSNPIYIDNVSNSYLGNLGSPAQSNIFYHRSSLKSKFLFMDTYNSYIQMPEDNLFFNTYTPYTNISYTHGGTRRNSENNLQVLHSRNIDPYWNVGFTYNLISSKGQYRNQKTKVYDFTFFTSYEKRRYEGYFFINNNTIDTEENGGVQNDFNITDTILNPENILVNFDDMKNKILNFNLFTTHHYNIGIPRKVWKKDDSLSIYPIKVVYTFRYERDRRNHYEGTVDTSYFENTYISTTSYNDKIVYSNMQNSFHLILNEYYFKWFKYGIRASLLNEQSKYEIPAVNPSGIAIALNTQKKKCSNTWLRGGIFQNKSDFLNWDVSTKIYVEGYRLGNWEMDGRFDWEGGKTKNHKISINAYMGTEKPDYLLENYMGNHQFWNNDFKNKKWMKLNADYHHTKWGLTVGTTFDVIKNYVYFNTSALPQQHHKNIRVYMVYAKGGINLWKFHFDQDIYYQYSNDEQVLPLPNFSIYSNNYFQSFIFNKAVLVRLGTDIHYHSKFYTPAYMPSTGRFYLQKEKKLGGYPEMNFYLNAKIKKTRIFLMYSHLNEKIGSRNYFSTLHYPINPGLLRWGVKWYFYD